MGAASGQPELLRLRGMFPKGNSLHHGLLSLRRGRARFLSCLCEDTFTFIVMF